MDMEKKQRRSNYLRKELAIARSLLSKYNSLKPMKCGGKKLSREDNITVLASFNDQTGRQIDEGAWSRLCSRLRATEVKKSENLTARPDDVDVTQGSDDNSNVNIDPMKSEECDEFIHSPVRNPTETSPCNYLHDGEMDRGFKGDISMTHQGAVSGKLLPPCTTPTDIEVKEDESAQEKVVCKNTFVNKQGLSDSLEGLHLQMVTIGDWISVQRASFDIHVKDEPYHSIQIYANLKTMKYVRRVWGISETSGELQRIEDLRDLCIATFYKSVVCIGYISPDPNKDAKLVEVIYPFKRWISSSCLIRYVQGHDGEAIGICSECSGRVTKIKKIGFKKDICSKLASNGAEQNNETKCEVHEDLNHSDFGDKNESSNIEMEHENSWSGSHYEAIMEEDYENHMVTDDETTMDSVTDDIGDNEIEERETLGNHDEVNEAYWQKLRGESQLSASRQRASDYTREEQKIDISLLQKYSSLKPIKLGGKKLSHEESITALATFNMRTGRQLDHGSWTKLCCRLRGKEVAMSHTKSDYDNEGQDAEQVLDDDSPSTGDMLEANPFTEVEVDNDELNKAKMKISKEMQMHKNTRKGKLPNTHEQDNMPISRQHTSDFTREERRIAISLLQKYSSLKPIKLGGKKLSHEESITALATFNVRTGRQLDHGSWTKLCCRLRGKEVDMSHTKSDYDNAGQDAKQVIYDDSPSIEDMLEANPFTEVEVHNVELNIAKKIREELQINKNTQKGKLPNIHEQKNMPISRQRSKSGYTKEEKRIAKSLLQKYNSFKPIKLGGKKLSHEDATAAFATFKMRTGRQIDLAAWTRLCSRLRGKEVEMSLAKSGKGVKCAKCPRIFGCNSILQKHIKKAHEQESMKELLTCDQCGVSLLSSSLEYHIKAKHTSYSDREYKCQFPDCKKAFVYSNQLRQHEALHDLNGKKFMCDHCGKSFHRDSYLMEHLRAMHKTLPELKLKCKHCDEVFGEYYDRTMHTNLVHFPNRFRCAICQKSFGREGKLKSHMNKLHTDIDLSRECPECGKKVSSNQFKSHMKLHTGDLVSCSYCSWKGPNTSMLYRHLRLNHKEQWERDQAAKEENFKCPDCGIFLMTARHLSSHVGLKHKKNTSYWRSVSEQSQS